MFIALEKDLSTGYIICQAHFDKKEEAEDWVEEMSTLYIEERAYKIIER